MMQSRMITLGAFLMLASAGPLHAQDTPTPPGTMPGATPPGARASDVVQSDITLALQVEVTDPTGTDAVDRAARIRKVSFSTKDLLDLVSDQLDRNDVRRLAVRRPAMAMETT